MNKVILSTLILLLAVQGLNTQSYNIFDFVISATISIASFVINVTVTTIDIIFTGTTTFFYANGANFFSAFTNQNIRLTLADIITFITSNVTLHASSWFTATNASFFAGSASYFDYQFVNASLAALNTSSSAVAWSVITVAAGLIGRGNCEQAPFPTTYNCAFLPLYNNATNCSTASLTNQALNFNATADILVEKIYNYAAYLERLNSQATEGCSCSGTTNITALVNGWLNLKASATAAINITQTNCTLLANINATAGADIQGLLDATYTFLQSADSCTNCTIFNGLGSGFRIFDICSEDGTTALFTNYSDGLTCYERNDERLSNLWDHFLGYFRDRLIIYSNTTQARFRNLVNYTSTIRSKIQTSQSNYNFLAIFYSNSKIRTAASGVSSALGLMSSYFTGNFSNVHTAMANYYASAQASSNASYTNYTNSVKAQAQALASAAISVNGINCTVFANVSAEVIANYSTACVECSNIAEEKFRQINVNASTYFKNSSDMYQWHVSFIDYIYSIRCSAASYWNPVSFYYGAKCPNDTFIWFNSLWGTANINNLSNDLNTARTNILTNTSSIVTKTANVISNLATQYNLVVQEYINCIATSASAASSAIATAQVGFDNCYAGYLTTTVAP